MVIERDPNPPPELDFEKTIAGNRIVNLGYVLQWATKLQYNHAKKCSAGILYPFKEINRGLGLVSYIEFRCTMCDEEIVHSTENPNKVASEINIGCVWGTLSTGSTYGHTEELFSAMNIPPLNKYMHYKLEGTLEKVCIYKYKTEIYFLKLFVIILINRFGMIKFGWTWRKQVRKKGI